MRPLVVDLGRDYRGGQHQALLLLQGLSVRGHAPQLITLRDSLLARRATDAGVSVHGVPPGCRRLAATLAIRRVMSGHQIDIVHANEPHALTAAWFARAHRSDPLIAARRIALPLSSNSFSLARYRAAACIIAVSHFVAKSVIASGLPAKSVEVIYDGVEIPPAISQVSRDKARSLLAIPPDAVCLGNVAALVPEKGHALLLLAFAELRNKLRNELRNALPDKSRAPLPQYLLLIAGEGPERTRLEELAQQYQLLDAVKFLGFVPDIESVYAALDVFIFPSHEEPLGSSLLSAMAHALPVVALARGGVPEVIETDRNGLLVNDLNPNSLANAMERLLSNPSEARRLGDAARETILTRFSADHMVDATLLLYKNVVG